MQMKRGLTARKSDKAFEEAVGNAWLDYCESNFGKQVDKLIIVHDQGSAPDVRGAREVCNFARSSISAADWVQKCTEKGISNTLRRNALDALRAAVVLYKKAAVTDEELMDFLRHVDFVTHDLDEEGTAEHTSYLNQITSEVRKFGLALDAASVWSRLVTACMRLNTENGGVSIETLSHVLDAELVVLSTAARQALDKPISLAGLTPPVQDNAKLLQGQHWIAPNPSLFHAVAAQSEQLSSSRSASVDKLISRQLDNINERIKSNRYANALQDLEQLGADFGPFDTHQRARWYHMRGICRWHQGNDAGAGQDFLKAGSLCSDDDRLAAAKVRGLLLTDDVSGAIAAGVAALERFPQSLAVWLAFANAKMRNDEPLTASDIPEQHKAEPDALQLVAWSLHSRGLAAQARQAILDASRLPTANFYTRNMALGLWLEHISSNRLNFSLQLLDAQEASTLRELVQEFEPRHEKLWHFEVPATAREAAVRLSVAHLFLGEPKEALTIIEEANARDAADGDTIKVEIEALSQLGRSKDAIARGKATLAKMSLDGIVAFAQLVSAHDDIALLDEVLEEARQRFPGEQSAHDVLLAMRWAALLSAGAGQSLLAEIDAKDLLSSQSVPLITTGSRALAKYRGEQNASALVSRALTLAESCSGVADRYMVGALLVSFGRYQEAANLYEVILPKGQYSDLHRDLLYCYLMTDQRKKASALIGSFPPGWEDDDSARHIAMEVGQLAGDWEFLHALVGVQIKKEPSRALSWLFKIMVNTRLGDEAALHEDIPPVLEGSVRELTQLATVELNQGKLLEGLQRLYRMRRLNLSSTDAAAAYVTAHLTSPVRLPQLHDVPEEVVPGTSVQIKDAAGAVSTVTLDPADLKGLPSTDEFQSSSSPLAQQILGRRLNDIFVVRDGFGIERTYSIASIETAYRRLLDQAHHALAITLTPSPTLSLVSLPEDEQGNTNFDALTAQLKAKAERTNEILRLYNSSPLTLGVTAKLLGHDVITLVQSWPAQKSPLHVGGSHQQERDEALTFLEDATRSYVVDAATLAELAQIDALASLALLPKVFVGSRTRDLVQAQLTLAKTDKSTGVASAEDGTLVYQEVSPEMREHRVKLLSEMAETIERHCAVVPAYGVAESPEKLAHVKEVTSEEEYDVLMVALEQNSTVLALDARLRAMAVYVGISVVWPQVVLLYQHVAGTLSLRDYAMACAEMFRRNRDFVSLRSVDVLILVRQGGFWLDVTMPKFIKQIALDTVEFKSAAEVTLGFFKALLLTGPCQFGAFLELVERILEGLFRHKQCPDDFDERAFLFLTHPGNIGSWDVDIRPHVRQAIINAKAVSRQEIKEKPFRAKVAFVAKRPLLLAGSAEQANSALAQKNTARPDVEQRDVGTSSAEPEPGFDPSEVSLR